MTAKSTLIELSKRLSDIESLIGHVDKDVAGDRNSEMTLETRGHNIRKFLNTFGEFFENGKFEDLSASIIHNLNTHTPRTIQRKSSMIF